MKICLTGGIACGKSLLSRYLNELGIETLDADDIVHELLPDPAERKRLAAEVFADPVKRRALEARLHPLVKAKINEAFTRADNRTIEQSNNQTILIAIIPLLFEAHWDAEFDIICCVESTRENQLLRLMNTRGLSRQEAESRLAAQLPVAEKAAKSHYVIHNDGTAEELQEQAIRFVNWLKQQEKQV